MNSQNRPIPQAPSPSLLHRLSSGKFARKVGVGFAGTIVLAIVIVMVAVFALRSVILANDLEAFNHAQALFDVERLKTKAQQQVAIARGFMVTRDGLFTEDARLANEELHQVLQRITQRSITPEDRKALARLKATEKSHNLSLQRTYRKARDKSYPVHRTSKFFNEDTMPKFDAWERALAAYAKIKESQLENARQEARAAGNRAIALILIIAAGALLLALTLGFVLTRTLTRLSEQVKLAVRSREDVLAIVSHDLRNPLSAIMLSSSMLLKNPNMPEEARTKLTRSINNCGLQMKRLIEDLLDFVKVEFGRMRVTKKLEDAHALLSDIHSIFVPLTREKNLELSYTVAPSITSIECEKGRLAQVLSNLLGNAIKFTPTGGQIQLNLTTVGHENIFSVRDTGPGIPSEQVAHVFDRYWQQEGSPREGVGLGLAIAKGLVEAHGGRIWVLSEPGKGTTFFFSIPVPGFKTQTETHRLVEGLRKAAHKDPVREEPAREIKPG